MAQPTTDERLLDVDLPRQVWSRSRRPRRGILFRAALTIALVFTGLAIPVVPATIALVTLGVGVFWLSPLVVDAQLERRAVAARGVSKAKATELLRDLEQPWQVAMFAPIGWVELQRGRLLLQQGDGRGAARALAECGRMCGAPKHPELLAGQARGYMLSGDRKEARALLIELEGQGKLDARSHLDLAIVLLGEGGRTSKAQEHIDVATRELGDHPQVAAARALALLREEQHQGAAGELIEGAANDARDDDPIAQELIKRARKLSKPAQGPKKAVRAERGAKPVASEPAGGRRGSKKKDKRKERRERRKKGKGAGDDSAAQEKAAQERAAQQKAAQQKAAQEKAA